VTAAELARTLDLSEASVHNYTRQGIIVRTGRGRYLREESIRRFVQHQRAQIEAARGGTDSATALRAEKIRLAAVQADKIAIANARERGELLVASEVEREWSDILRSVSVGMLTVAAQCGQKLPHLSRSDVVVIDGEIRAKLTELGGGNG
jgi:phage terminase Nu1 subunit (DNA packaging protein)